MKISKYALYILIFVISLNTSGCFKEIVETREPLPDIIWPPPPEAPRIRFINSISGPEDLKIKEPLSRRIFTFLKGKIKTSIVKPYGVVTDDDGRLFVVDNFARIVHVFHAKNNTYYTFPGEDISFISPIDVAVDRLGNVYVSDSMASAVRIFAENGKKYIGDAGKDILNRPSGVAVNEVTNELLVIDTTTSHIIRFDLATYRYKGNIGRNGDDPGAFHYPTNIFVSRDGRIFVTDSLNFRVQIFSPEGKFISTFGKAGDSPGFFSRPRGVAVDSDGNIYVVDAMFDNVQLFNSNGELLMDFGKPGHSYGQFWLPAGIFIDSDDMIYVADSYNKRVQIFQYLKQSD